ncbi:hypothetical protein [Gellertiella hungarica]|uniref:Uncharacterized protein n=1 Tax=Gellertiella hungarica TaxID=1572859 RepID=A0A7W6NK89_9HYPH|nr:hypothetical protein [Gellertiella hungarica]MBB4064042.1 hypothetical protein [Gellertiella hungarica]
MAMHSKSKPFVGVHVLIGKVDDDVLRKLSLCLSDFLLDRDVAEGERICTGQLSIFVSAREASEGMLWVEMTVCHQQRADEISDVVYRHDVRERSSLFHIADFLETREWADQFFKIAAAVHG